jgi:hypothetical protein
MISRLAKMSVGLACGCTLLTNVDSLHSNVSDAGDATSAAISFVQANANGKPKVTSITVPLTSNVTAHDSIIVGIVIDNSLTVTLTDTLGNTFVNVLGPIDGNLVLSVGAAFDVIGGADSVTATIQGSMTSDVFDVYVAEYRGVSAFDVGSFTPFGSSAAVDGMVSGAAQTTANGELIVGIGGTQGGTAASGTGFTSLSLLDGNVFEAKIVAAPASYQATATMLSGSGWSMMMAAFK